MVQNFDVLVLVVKVVLVRRKFSEIFYLREIIILLISFALFHFL